MDNKSEITVLRCYAPKNRLDQVLRNIFFNFSRTHLQSYIVNNQILVNGLIINKPKTKIYLGDQIKILQTLQTVEVNTKENIPINIIYEDEYILIINKQAGLIVHPGSGCKSGTLFNALLYRNSELVNIPRAGIIHRLDKNTTGLMIIAKNILAYYKLVELIKQRKIIREYDAFVLGDMISGGTVNAPISRNYKKRFIMTVNSFGKPAVTHYQIVQKFKYYTHIHLRLETGRTHQIRVHMLNIKHPILGDPIYSLKNFVKKNISSKRLNKINSFCRQALHASHIKFQHPIKNIIMNFYAFLPNDMINIIKYL